MKKSDHSNIVLDGLVAITFLLQPQFIIFKIIIVKLLYHRFFICVFGWEMGSL